MQTKNLSLHPVILVAKALPQHLVLPLQSKPVISVFNRVSPATAATHAVFFFLVHSPPFFFFLTFLFSAKCVQRKCRCSFVKFHRQTAPVGPGHNPRPSPANSQVPMSDDYHLGSSSLSMASIPDNIYSHQFSFPPNGFPPILDPNLSNSLSDHQFIGQTAMPGPQLPSDMYSDQHSSSSWLGWSQDSFDPTQPDPNSMTPRYLLDDPKQQQQQQQQQQHQQQLVLDKDLQYAFSQQFLDQENLQSQPFVYPMNGDDFQNRKPGLPHGHIRRGSLDLSSDGSHPSSAASSSVHLPLDMSSQPMSFNVRLICQKHGSI
jgi:hypothetical protein